MAPQRAQPSIGPHIQYFSELLDRMSLGCGRARPLNSTSETRCWEVEVARWASVHVYIPAWGGAVCPWHSGFRYTEAGGNSIPSTTYSSPEACRKSRILSEPLVIRPRSREASFW